MITTIQWVETKDGEILAKKGEAYYRLSEISITDFLRENGIHPDQLKEKEEKPVETKENTVRMDWKRISRRRGEKHRVVDEKSMTKKQRSLFMTSEEICDKYFSDDFDNCRGLRQSVARHLSLISLNYNLPIIILKHKSAKNKIYAYHMDAFATFINCLSRFVDEYCSTFKYLKEDVSQVDAGGHLAAKAIGLASHILISPDGERIYWENVQPKIAST